MKKRILTVALVVALLATCFAGTYAYLTDEHTQKNTFTTGNVGISLDEAVVEKDAKGNLVANGEERTIETQSYHLYPAMTVTKDPTITVDTKSEHAWVAAKVVIKGDIYDLLKVDGTDMIDINKVASGGLIGKALTVNTNWNGLKVHETEDCVIYQDADKTNNTWTLYIFMKAEQKADAKIVLFDTLTIPADWNNAEMAKVNGMSIDVQAFATQTNGFVDCYTAMTTAFGTDFNFS